MTYEEIAQATGMSKNNLTHWMNQRYEPRLGQLDKVARAFGYEVRLLRKQQQQKDAKK